MNRAPPKAVRRQLRAEVGFGCPVDGCGNPYLTWHHFDPPWSEKRHHEPEGMIALCQEHHAKADAGAFTVEQLRALKATTHRSVRGRFDWMRREILTVVGGNFCLRTPIAVALRGSPCVWLTRDDAGYALLNIDMPSALGFPRMQMRDNWWISQGGEKDIECPPKGSLVSAIYPNGDRLKVEFVDLPDRDAFETRFPNQSHSFLGLGGTFPITTIEVEMRVSSLQGVVVDFNARETRIGTNSMVGCWMADCTAGIGLS